MVNLLFHTSGRKAFAAILALLLALCMLPGAAKAAGTVHEVDTATELTGAFTTAASGDTIKLTGDITLTSTSRVSFIIYSNSDARNLTLDLNGSRILVENGSPVPYFIELNGTGTLTIADSAGGGSINGGNMLSWGIIGAYGYSNVAVTGGALISACRGIIGTNGTITVSGGTITSTGDDKSAIAAETSDVIVSGGTVEASGTGGAGITINGSGGSNITLTGLCTIKGQSAAITGKPPVINTSLLTAKASTDDSGSPLVPYVASDYAGYKYISITAVAPVITTQPVNQTVVEGQTATFTVAVTGDPVPGYQWYSSAKGRDWDEIGGERSSSFTIAATTLASNGTHYYCTATNAAGSAISSVATLTVVAPAGVSVTTLPAAAFVQGNAPELTVTVNAASIAGFNATSNFGGIDSSSQLKPNVGTITTPGTDGKVEDGSIKFTLNQSYLNTLAPGTHSLRIKLKGNLALPPYAQAYITVTAPGAGGDVGADVPKTGDGSQPALWAGLALLAGAGLCVRALCHRKKRHSN